jgi:hypothetical protein
MHMLDVIKPVGGWNIPFFIGAAVVFVVAFLILQYGPHKK